MSPLGAQRVIAIIIFLSPWIYVPTALKELVFIVAGALLFISTLDIRKNTKTKDTPHKDDHQEGHHAQTVSTEHHHPTVPNI